jgi:hypothetical protein
VSAVVGGRVVVVVCGVWGIGVAGALFGACLLVLGDDGRWCRDVFAMHDAFGRFVSLVYVATGLVVSGHCYFSD